MSRYNYIANESAKEPRPALDAEVWLSVDHPRGDKLKRLLEAGARQAKAFGGRGAKRGSSSGGDTEDVKRFRSGDVYALVAKEGLQTVLEIQNRASELASKGDETLAEFCTVVGQDKLDELVQSALAVTKATKALALKNSTRMEFLRKAA